MILEADQYHSTNLANKSFQGFSFNLKYQKLKMIQLDKATVHYCEQLTIKTIIGWKVV